MVDVAKEAARLEVRSQMAIGMSPRGKKGKSSRSDSRHEKNKKKSKKKKKIEQHMR